MVLTSHAQYAVSQIFEFPTYFQRTVLSAVSMMITVIDRLIKTYILALANFAAIFSLLKSPWSYLDLERKGEIELI